MPAYGSEPARCFVAWCSCVASGVGARCLGGESRTLSSAIIWSRRWMHTVRRCIIWRARADGHQPWVMYVMWPQTPIRRTANRPPRAAFIGFRRARTRETLCARKMRDIVEHSTIQRLVRTCSVADAATAENAAKALGDLASTGYATHVVEAGGAQAMAQLVVAARPSDNEMVKVICDGLSHLIDHVHVRRRMLAEGIVRHLVAAIISGPRLTTLPSAHCS